MISSNCSIGEFLKEVEKRDPLEIIHLADLEATEAERMLLRPSTNGKERETCGLMYARSLKALINDLRCRVNRVAVDSDELQLFQSLEETSIPSSVGIREIP
jgi:hypothetical protein